MKPDVQVVNAPGVSRFTMVLPPLIRSSDAQIRTPPAADSNLIVLYAGPHPCPTDSTACSSTTPHLLPRSPVSGPPPPLARCAGFATVIMALEHGAFVLAFYHLGGHRHCAEEAEVATTGGLCTHKTSIPWPASTVMLDNLVRAPIVYQ